MNEKIKKFLSVLLIVAMTITNAGFSVLAESVDSVVTDAKINQEETPNYYFELEYEKETIVEEFENILEKQNPDVLDNESEGEEFEEEESVESEDAEEVLFEEEPEEESKEESEAETEKEIEENVSEKEESFEEETSEEAVKESSNESKEEEKEETSESEKKSFDVEEIIASESDVNKEAPINIDEEEATESEIEKETKTENFVEEISTESETLEAKEEATKSEVEKEVVEKEVASESEVEAESATMSEAESATSSEVALATESEVEASISETKEVVYATISKTIWKVKRFLLDDVSETQVKTSEEEAERMSRLATNANVVLINDKGEERIININLKWKLVRDIEVNAVGGVDEAAIPVEVLHEKFNVKEVINEVNKGHVYSTVNEAELIDKAKEASEELGKEIVIIEQKASNSVVVEKVLDGEIVKETKIENDEVKVEETVAEIERTEENKTNENLKEEVYEETGFSEEELKEIIAEEEVVAAFSETEETSTISEVENISEDVIEEANEEINEEKNEEASTESEALEEKIEETDENEEETSTYSNLPTQSGLTSTFAIKDRVKDYYDLRNIYLYTIDTEEASKEIMNAINAFSDEEEKEVKTDAEKEEDDDVKSFFDSLFGFFFGNKGTESNEESSNKESSDINLSNEKNKDSLSMLFSNPNIDILDSTPSMPMVMMNAMRFGAGVAHKHSHLYFDDDASNTYINLDLNNIINTGASLDFIADWDTGEDGALTDNVSGTYALGANTTLHNKFQLSTGSTLTICLNGFTLKFATASYIFGEGTVNIVNCDGEGYVKTSEPQKNWRDQFFATTNETYTRYNDRGPFNVSKVNIIGDACDDTDSKIVFENCQIKNVFTGKLAKNKMQIIEDDLPETGGGGSLITAKEKAQVYKTNFIKNMATRSNGVAINTFMGSLVVDECEFDGNKNLTNKGGAIAFNPGATVIHNTTFKNNTSETFGGALYGRQYTNMGVPISGGTKIIGSTFENNRALREGGAIFLDYFTDVTIGGDNAVDKTVFRENVAGGMGGAVAVVHINSYDSKELIEWDQQTANLGTLNIKNSEFKQNEAHALKKGANYAIVDDPNCENHMINYGGALYVNNRDINNQDGTASGDRIIQGPTVLQKINIDKSTFEENRAVGEKMFASTNSESSTVTGDIEYHFNNYGGAAYIKGVDTVNVTGSKFTDNQSMNGGTFCISEKTNLNIGADTEIKGGSGLENINDYLQIDTSDPNEHKKAKIENLLITPAGGAVYVMNASVSVAVGAKITENFNAVYLAKGDIDLGSTEVNGNIGEYLIGFTNDFSNQILFNGVNIKGNKFYGSGKNYTELNAAHMAVKNTYIAFKDANTIKENREISAKNDNGNGEDGTEVNIDLRSSLSNIKLDLSKYSFRVHKDGMKGKIGLHFDIDETTTSEIDPDTGQAKYLHDKDIVVPNWDAEHSVIFREGVIWTYYFTLDNSQLGGTTWDSNWKYYTKDGHVRISPNIFTVRFETYFEGEDIEEQFYNYKRGSGEYIKLSTPMEVVNADGTLTKRTFVGFLGQNKAIGTTDPEKWVVWDFENCRMKASREDDEGLLIAVYTDDTVKVKACGCDIGTTCNHIDGSSHVDRGAAATNDRQNAAYQNYVIIATAAHLAYRHNDKKTQFTLQKDMTLTSEDIKNYNAKDIVLNLNGKTLTYVPSSDKDTPFIGSTKFSSYSNALYYTSEPGIYITGKASESQTQRGKIRIQGNHNNAFIDSAGLNVYIKDVDFEDIDAGTNDSKALFTSTGSNANFISLEDVTFNNIKLNNDLINGFDNIYINRVETKENIDIPDYSFIRGRGVSATPTPSTVIKESKIKNINAKYLFDADTSAENGTRKINISTSSITNNKFTDALVDFTTPGFSGTTCIGFDGKVDIKENEVTGSGRELINLGSFDWNPEANMKADVTVSGNIVPAVDGNTIIRAEGIGKLYVNDGKLIVTGNKAAGENTTAEISAITMTPISKFVFGSGSAKINENNVKYNFLIDNDIASSVSNVFDLRTGSKLKSEDSNIKIRLKDSTLEQKLFNDWNTSNVEGLNLPENVFDQDPSYNTDPEPIKNTKSYKWTQSGKKEIHFGKEYVVGSFKLYEYANDGQDERVAHPEAYDHAIAEENEQRLRRNAITDLDKPTVIPPIGKTYIWEGLYYKEDDDATKEEFYGTDISALTINAEKNFEISGYISNVHQHTGSGEEDMTVEVRNEGHIQATTSRAYLHNDLHITRPLTKLTGDFTLCLNGHKLIIDKNLTWIDAFNGNNVTIENCSWNPEGSIEAKDQNVVIATPFITVRNGAKFNVKNISINNMKATESFIDVKTGAKLNVDKLLIDKVEADYSGNNDEQSFIETNNNDVENATYSNIKITNSKIYGPNVEEKKEFIRIKSKTSAKLTLDGFKLNGNIMKGDAYLVRAIADNADIDINNFEITNNTSEISDDATKFIHNTALFVKGDNKDVNISGSTFNENKISGDTEVVVPPPPEIPISGSNYPATIMFGGDVANLKIEGSEFKNNLSNSVSSNLVNVTTTLQVENNVKKVVIKDTTFDNNNQSTSTQNNQTRAIKFERNEKVNLENTTFTGGNKEVDMMLISYPFGTTVDGKVTFNNGTKFTSVKAKNVINIYSYNKGQVTFDGIEFVNNEGTNVIYTDGGVKIIATNSIMRGSKATDICISDTATSSTELTLTNFTIENAGDQNAINEAIHAGAIKKIVVNEKVVIKGHKKNLVMGKNIYDGTSTELVVGSGHKLLDGSEIYMTALPDDAKFFTQWNKTYIEKYETTDLSNGFSYHPSKIFKYDDASFLSYREGVSNLYSAKNTSTNYATLKYVDEEIQGTPAAQKYITEQYVKVSSVTTVDHVQVNYVGTTSQVWLAEILPGGGIATWRVKNRYTVNVNTPGVHLMKLTKMHIHLECGCEYGIEPCNHIDGSVHNVEFEFIKVKDASAFIDPDSYYFGLDNDVTINQAAADALKAKAALLATPVVICLNGHNLTFGNGVTFENIGGKVTFVNCCDTGAIKTAGVETSAIIKQSDASGTLKFYNTVFDGCKVTSVNATGVVVATAGTIFAENLKFKNCVVDYTGSDATTAMLYIESNNRNNNYLDNITFEGNNTKVPALSLAGKYINENNISTISFIGNTYKAKLLDIYAADPTNNKVKIKKLHLEGNTTTEEYSGMVNVWGPNAGNFEVEEDLIVKGNNVKGNLFYENGTQTSTFNKDVTFIQNTAGKGAIKLEQADQKLIFKGNFLAKENTGTDAAVINVQNMNASSITFEKNVVFDGNSSNEAVIVYDGTLDLKKATFKNHGTACGNIIKNRNAGDIIKLATPTFINNNVSGNILNLYKVGAGSEIYGINDETNGNKAQNFILLDDSSNLVFRDSTFKGNTFTKAGIKIATPGNVIFKNINVADNTTAEGAVSISGGKVEIQDEVKIYGNPSTGGLRDIFIADDNAYIYAATETPMTSRLSFYPHKSGIKVYEGWVNKDPDTTKTDTRQYMITPENCGVFPIAGKAQSENYNIYRKGTNAADEKELYMGKENQDFVTVTFIYDEESPHKIYGYQNIAKDVETTLSKVDAGEGIPIVKQAWEASSSGATAIWNFSLPTPVLASVSISEKARYQKPHLHPSETDQLTPVANLAQINDVAYSGGKFVVLKADIELTNVTNTSLKGICLNGHKLTIRGNDGENPLAAFNVGGDFEICDCKGEGYITMKDGETRYGDVFNVTSGTTKISVPFKNMSIKASGSNTGHIIEVLTGATVDYAYATISNITIDSTDGLIKSNGNVNITDLLLTNNTVNNGKLLDNTNVKITGDLIVKDNTFNTKVGMKLNNTSVSFTKVIFDNNTISSTEQDSYIVDMENTSISNDLVVTNNKETNEPADKTKFIAAVKSNNTHVSGDVLFENNKFKAKGAGLVVDGTTNVGYGLKVDGNATFRNNESNNGSGAYIEQIFDDDALVIAGQTTFDNNKVAVVEAGTPGIQNAVFVLASATLSNVIFKNHVTAADLISQRNMISSPISLSSISFIDNNTTGEAMHFGSFGNITIKDVKVQNSKFKTFLGVDGVSGKFIKLEDTDLSGAECSDVSVYYKDGDLLLKDVKIENKDTSKPSLRASVNDKGIDIQGNINIGKTELSNKVYFNATGMISSTSNIVIKSAEDGALIYKSWDATHIEMFDSHDESLPDTNERRFMYTPENSGLFTNEVNTAWSFYKAKTANSEVHLGSQDKYVEVTFKYIPSDTELPTVTYGVQRISKASPSRFDRVDMIEYEFTDQEWHKPTGDGTELLEKFNPDMIATYNNVASYDIKLEEKHVHKVCGLKRSETCAHDGYNHSETRAMVYKEVHDLTELASTEYAELENDIEVTGQIYLNNVKGLCLNGHRILFMGTSNTDDYYNSFLALNHDLSICDCKCIGENADEHGAIAFSPANISDATKRQHADFIKTGSYKLGLYNMYFEGTNITRYYDGVASHTTNGALINAENGGVAYLEKVRVASTARISDNGLFKTGNTGKIYMRDVTIKESRTKGGSSAVPLTTLTANMIISTLSIIDNIYEGAVSTIPAFIEINGDVNINKLVFRNNEASSIGQGLIGIKNGSTLTLKEDAVIESNKVSDRGAINLGGLDGYTGDITGGTLRAYKKILFRDNNAYSNGGALYVIGNTAKVRVDGGIIFEGNHANLTGGAIYGKNITEDTFGTTSITFDNNYVGVDGDPINVLKGAVQWTGTLKLEKPEFINHTDTKTTLIKNDGSADKLILIDPVFKDNTLVKDAIYLNNIQDGSKISGMSEESTGNTFWNFIDLHSGKLTVGDGIISGIKSPDALINVESSAELTIGTVSISNNKTDKGAIFINGGAEAKVIGKVDVRGNKDSGGDIGYDIKLSDNTAKLSAAGIVDKDSKLTISANADTVVFEDWNNTAFEKYDNPDMDVEDEVMYTPESSGIFLAGKGNEGHKFYISGDTSTNKKVKLGANYAVARFINRKEVEPGEPVEPDKVYGTQYVEKNADTMFDKVDTFEYELEYQEWHMPYEDGGWNDDDLESFFRPGEMKVNYTKGETEKIYEVKYEQKHYHKECGLNVHKDCNHDPAVTHTGSVEWKKVKTVDEINNVNTLYAGLTPLVERIVLDKDIVADNVAIVIPNNIKGLCLNGHTITMKHTGLPLITANNDFTITNCKEEGGIVGDNNVTLGAPLINIPGLTGTPGSKLKMYNIAFKNITSNASYIKLENTAGDAYLERVRFEGNKNVGATGVIDAGHKVVASNLIFKNNNISSNNPLINITDQLEVATLSVVSNTLKGSAVNVSTDYAGKLKYLEVTDNTTTGENGIVYVANGKEFTVDSDSLIKNNKAVNGGAIYVEENATLKLMHDLILESNVADKGGAIYVAEGGKINNSADKVLVFNSNKAKNGSAIYIEGSPAGNIDIGENTTFKNEESTETGIITFNGDLDLKKVTFENEKANTVAFITKLDGNEVRGLGNLSLTDIVLKDNVLSKNADVINVYGSNVSLNGLTVINTDTTKKNNFKNFINVRDDAYVEIQATTISNAIYEDSIIKAKNVYEVRFNNSTICDNTMKGSAIDLVNSKATNTANFVIKNNTTTGAKGAAMSIDPDSEFVADGEKLSVTENTSVGGGAIYNQGKFTITDKETNISGNKTSVANTRPKDLYIVNPTARITLKDGSNINGNSKIALSVANNNQVVFENWDNTRFNPYGTTHSNNPDIVFVPDEFSKKAKQEIYKTGLAGSQDLKFGTNFVKLSFQNANKTTVWSKQNIEKDVETSLDEVKISNVSAEKWIFPANTAAGNDQVRQFTSPLTAKYSTSQPIIKWFKYNIVYTAGSKEGVAIGNVYGHEDVEYGSYITLNPNGFTVDGATFTKWSLKSAPTGQKADYQPGEQAKNLCDVEGGTAYIEARWTGEAMARFYGNGDLMGIGIAYNDLFNKLVPEGTVITLNKTYDSSYATEDFNDYTTYNTKPDGTGTTYNVGQTITLNRDIELYCMWKAKYPDPVPVPPPPVPPDPRPRSSGGGGGGGGYSGVIRGTSKILNQLPGKYTVNADGFVVDSNGNVVGHVSFGDHIDEFGNWIDGYGNRHNPDGSITSPIGLTFNLDGSITDANGVTYMPDGTIVQPKGDRVDANGVIHKADGSIVAPDGTIYHTDGSIEFPDGTILLPSGNVQKNPAENADAKSTIEFNPTINKWQFFVINADGTKEYQKDKWVKADNNKGKETWYIADSSGNMVTGWVKIEGEYYFMSTAEENKGEIVTGTITIDGKTYTFDQDGKLQGNDKPKDITVIGAVNHKAGVDGDWKKDANGGTKFYQKAFDEHGKEIEVPVSGWFMIDGSYYFFGDDNYAKTGLIEYDGKYYYMQKDGTMLEGGDVEIDGIVYSFDKATGACRSALKK